jgi:hypothetical protein
LKEVGYVIPFAQNLTSDIVKEDGTCSFCKKEEKHLKKKTSKSKNTHRSKCENCKDFVCKNHSIHLCDDCWETEKD